MCDGVSKGYYHHIVTGIRQGGVRCAEKAQDGIHPHQGHEGENNARYDIEGDIVAKDLAGAPVVLLAQKDGNHGGGSNAHKGAESRGDIHEREGYRKAGH